MKGSYQIRVRNQFVSFEFTIRRNITIIQGNSATGKTTLIDMIREWQTVRQDSGVELHCDKNCAVIEGFQWKEQLAAIPEDSIIFIDEGNRFTATEEFARTVRQSGHYYVIVAREPLYNLPYSVSEIYGIRSSGRYAHLHPVYHEFYPVYMQQERGVIGDNRSHKTMENNSETCHILTEDSNSGYQFFSAVAGNSISCHAGEGNTALFEKLKDLKGAILVVADGAAFGSNMRRVIRWTVTHPTAMLYLPESFEWVILSSGLIDGNRIRNILENPSEYVESSQYVSWERFFTRLLIDETKGTYLQYGKASLNPVYLHKHNAEAIIHAMPEQVQKWLQDSGRKTAQDQGPGAAADV